MRRSDTGLQSFRNSSPLVWTKLLRFWNTKVVNGNKWWMKTDVMENINGERLLTRDLPICITVIQWMKYKEQQTLWILENCENHHCVHDLTCIHRQWWTSHMYYFILWDFSKAVVNTGTNERWVGKPLFDIKLNVCSEVYTRVLSPL